jgi:hypothetical protein
MNGHETPQDENILADREYQDYPGNKVKPVTLYRQERDKEGNPTDVVVAKEVSWMATGTSVKGGVEYTQVVRLGADTYELDDIPTDKLEQWQKQERQEKAAREVGEQTISVIDAANKAAYDAVTQDIPHNPTDDMITPEEKAKLRKRAEIERLEEWLEQLPSKDRAALKMYAYYSLQAEIAGARGNNESVKYFEDGMQEELNRMSEDVRNFAADVVKILNSEVKSIRY